MRPPRFLIPFAGLLLLTSSAGATLRLEPETPSVSADGHLEVLDDPSRQLSLDDVLHGAVAQRFRALPGALSRGFTRDATWVRFAVERAEGAPRQWLLVFDPPTLDALTVYVQEGGDADTPRGYREVRTGDHLPVASRPLPHALFVMPLSLDSERPVRIYARIETTSTSALRATLTTAPAFAAWSTLRSHILGACYGVILWLSVLTLVHWAVVRDSVYAWYALYALSLLGGFLASTGSLFQVLPAWGHRLSDFLVVAAACGGMATVLPFISGLLELPRTAPWAHRVLIGLAIAGAAAAPVGWGWGLRAVAGYLYATVFPSALLVAGLGLWAALKRNPAGAPACLAFLSSAAGVIVTSLATLGVLPHTPLTRHAYLAGTLTQMVLLNIALYLRQQSAERDKLAAQKAVLAGAEGAEQRARELAAGLTRELVASHRHLEQALASEQEARREQVRFIDLVSHEYRTPVAVLTNGVNSLRHRLGNAGPEIDQNLARMERALTRLVEIVERGLGLIRPAANRGALDLGEVISQAVGELQEAFPQREVRWQPASAPSHFRVSGDRPLLVLALHNLLENALKYTAGQVTVELHGEDGQAVIAIQDEGSPLPPEMAEQVFERAFRGPNSADSEGTGIGLHLVREIAEAHRGTVCFEHLPGAGNTVRLTLPLVA